MTQWSTPEVARSWVAAAVARNRMMAAATEQMFALAGIRPGARVLDLGTGTGDTALMLAERIALAGEVVATDISAQMVEAATSAVREAGLSNVTVRLCSAASLEGIGTFDAVVARNVLMFVPDLDAALSSIRGVLRPGGRFAAVTWSALDDNPFNAAPIRAVERRRPWPQQPPEVVRAFSLSNEASLRGAFERGGFASVSVVRVPGTRGFSSLADAMDHLATPLYEALLELLGPDDRRAARAEIERTYARYLQPDGTVSFPITSLVTAGENGATPS